jgi:dTDP-4-dehydrorhamnose 3,5-epimerase
MKDIVRDPATVSASGKPLGTLPHGVRFRPAATHFDDRGSVCELYDERWGWHEAPLVFSYMFTLRPNKVKGWGMHLDHDDRYFVLFGEMEVVMYDTREDSPTKGLLAKVHLSEWERRLCCIPIGVWHANFNPGSKDAVIINFPTKPYDHDNPDKYRLPVDTDQIPYKFPQGASGW